MDISFANSKLRRSCERERERIKTWGEVRGKALGARLDDLRAAEHLGAMRTLPGRCHELLADRAGQLALVIGQPYRLIFKPATLPTPKLASGGLDWDRVTFINILEVVDYHG